MNSTPRTIVAGLAVAAIAAVPVGASAKHGAEDGAAAVTDDRGRDNSRAASRSDEKRVAGTCTGRASATLKAKPDDGRLEAEFEVDQNRNGVTWMVRMSLDGKRVVSARATTRAPSGSFSVERRLADRRGSDRITARAVSPSGQVCRASLTI